MIVNDHAVDCIAITLHVEYEHLRRLVDDIRATGKKPTITLGVNAFLFGSYGTTGYILEKEPGSTHAVLLSATFETPDHMPAKTEELAHHRIRDDELRQQATTDRKETASF